MSSDVLSISPEASLVEARTRMRTGGVRHLVVQKDRRILGVISERDLGGTKLRSADGVVADVMTGNVVTASPETTVRRAANLLRGRTIGCLPIVDGERAVGIVTTTDLLEVLGSGAERPVERGTRWTLRDRGPRGTGASARRVRGG